MKTAITNSNPLLNMERREVDDDPSSLPNQSENVREIGHVRRHLKENGCLSLVHVNGLELSKVHSRNNSSILKKVSIDILPDIQWDGKISYSSSNPRSDPTVFQATGVEESPTHEGYLREEVLVSVAVEEAEGEVGTGVDSSVPLSKKRGMKKVCSSKMHGMKT
ncbi:hypothetical protein Q3G72_010641 [Acer saccharum]|nr:hypothetical protein Q3G72_010641 [Acer saccharum]